MPPVTGSTVKPVPIGPPKCVGCGLPNEYQTQAYTCWSCRHGAPMASVNKTPPTKAASSSTGLTYNQITALSLGCKMMVLDTSGLPKDTVNKLSKGTTVILKKHPQRNGGGALVAPITMWLDRTTKPIYLRHDRLIV